jgi:hypothetical protein
MDTEKLNRNFERKIIEPFKEPVEEEKFVWKKKVFMDIVGSLWNAKINDDKVKNKIKKFERTFASKDLVCTRFCRTI